MHRAGKAPVCPSPPQGCEAATDRVCLDILELEKPCKTVSRQPKQRIERSDKGEVTSFEASDRTVGTVQADPRRSKAIAVQSVSSRLGNLESLPSFACSCPEDMQEPMAS